MMSFYHYTGSLTTPACAEIVQWIVLDKPFYVHKNLVSIVTVLEGGGCIQDFATECGAINQVDIPRCLRLRGVSPRLIPTQKVRKILLS